MQKQIEWLSLLSMSHSERPCHCQYTPPPYHLCTSKTFRVAVWCNLTRWMERKKLTVSMCWQFKTGGSTNRKCSSSHNHLVSIPRNIAYMHYEASWTDASRYGNHNSPTENPLKCVILAVSKQSLTEAIPLQNELQFFIIASVVKSTV